MRFKQLAICFFTGYLVLLLNFGPSLHRAHIFGFHHQPNSTASRTHHSHCCSGALHSPSTPDHSQTVQRSHDCSFCKFFDQYHAPDVVKSNPFCIDGVERFGSVISTRFVVSLLFADARGPPLYI